MEEMQKPKKSCLGQLIKWLLILGIFGGLGYLIWKNGGIPEGGFNLGEMVGTETPEGLVDEELLERIHAVGSMAETTLEHGALMIESDGKTFSLSFGR
jgi:hypothetical protein